MKVLLLALLVCAATAKPQLGNLKTFSWNTDCGPNDPITISKLDVSPDPVELPGNATVSVTVVSSVDIPDELGNIVTITLSKEQDGEYVDLPCLQILPVGSCSYDLCPTLEELFPDEDCPEALVQLGIPCHCSQLKAGTYDIEGAVLAFPLELPADLTDGDYKANLKIVGSDESEFICLDIYLTLEVVEE